MTGMPGGEDELWLFDGRADHDPDEADRLYEGLREEQHLALMVVVALVILATCLAAWALS